MELIPVWLQMLILAAIGFGGYYSIRIVKFKKMKETVMAFQKDLKENDTVILQSGVIGVITKIEKNIAYVKISNNTVVEVDKYYIVRKK